MPYDPDAMDAMDLVPEVQHQPLSAQPGISRGNEANKASPAISAGRRDEPRGIARYFQAVPQTRDSRPPRPQGNNSPAATMATAPASTPAPAARVAPAPPALARTPSRIAVIIESSSRRSTSQLGPQKTSRDASEDSVDLVTSDINPPRRPRTAPSHPPEPLPPSTTKPPASTLRTPRTTAAGPSSTAPSTTAPKPTPKPATQTPTTQPTKHRGRPVGWRPGMGPYSAKSSFPGGPSAPRTATTPKAAPKRRPGRPPGRPGVRPTRAIFEKLRPRYVSFLCEWPACPAELQNIDTLRRHILAVHGGQSVCRWGKCGEREKTFPSRADFERHVEEAHLVPFAWHVGDGPRNSVMEYRVPSVEEAEDGLPGYLFDGEGNQVTPSVLYQEFENEEEKRARRRRLHRLILERDRNAPLEEPETSVVEGVGGAGGRR